LALPLGSGARHRNASFVSVGSGYDWSRDAPVFAATAELHVWGAFSMRGGASYAELQGSLRPTFGVVWQALRHEAHYIDLALSVDYRPEGFTEPEGEVETIAAVGLPVGPLVLVLSAAYGQDPEGNERDTEARLAIVGDVAKRVILGADSRLRVAIASPASGPDAGRDYDVVMGPFVSVAHSSWALTGQIGLSTLALDTGTETGAMATLCLAYAYRP
jgi:hypothetical protein